MQCRGINDIVNGRTCFLIFGNNGFKTFLIRNLIQFIHLFIVSALITCHACIYNITLFITNVVGSVSSRNRARINSSAFCFSVDNAHDPSTNKITSSPYQSLNTHIRLLSIYHDLLHLKIARMKSPMCDSFLRVGCQGPHPVYPEIPRIHMNKTFFFSS